MMRSGYFQRMRFTVDIAEEDLKELVKLTGERKKGTAVSKAVTEFIHRKRAKEFGKLLREGAFDYPFTNDEIENAGE